MSTTLAASYSTGSPLWFVTRSSALVAFGLLTVTLLLGLLTTGRAASSAPRFVTQALHRNATLLALAFVVVHIVSTLLDGFVPVGWAAVVVPFTSGYRTTWVAAGTLAFDLAILLTVTSLARVRIGLRVWRGIHWLAYALWPLTLVHYLGAGTDVRATWGRWLAILSIVVVVGAVVARVAAAVSARKHAPAARPVRGAPVGRPAGVAPVGRPAGVAPVGRPAGVPSVGRPAGVAPVGRPVGAVPAGRPPSPDRSPGFAPARPGGFTGLSTSDMPARPAPVREGWR
jgi:sulfoxide reductase heme-binding subunit YedZ